MNTLKWLEKVAGGATRNAIAERAGIYPSTLNKQIEKGELSAEVVVKIARAYSTSIIEGLVACGHITREEAGLRDHIGLEYALREATDQQLLQELLRRVDEEGTLAHPTLVEPVDNVIQFPGTPTEGMTDSEVASLMRSEPQRNAALNPGYAPEDEYDQ